MKEKPDKTPFGWGSRFKSLARAKGLERHRAGEDTARAGTLADIAEKVGKSESALRSYTNGTRPIQLADFLQLCKAAEIDPATVLFSGSVDPQFLLIGEAWVVATDLQKGVLVTAAKGVLAERGESSAQRTNARKGGR